MLGAMGCDGDRMFVTCDRMFVKEGFGERSSPVVTCDRIVCEGGVRGT